MKKTIICIILILGFINLNALPSGENIDNAGNTTVSTAGNTMTVMQDDSLDKVIIAWESFNLADGEIFRVIQENDTDILLNKVNSASYIDGKIEANGSVWIINQNSIVFGENAVIDVNGFLASNLDITDEDFLNDTVYNFNIGTSTATITNNGSIVTKGIEGYVVLAGYQVVNNGYIAARFGKVALGAGTAITVDFNGDGLLNFTVGTKTNINNVDHNGIIDVSSQIVAPTGADATLTQLVVDSNAAASTVTQAGDVLVFGGTVNITGKISANGSQEGESIVNGGKIEINAGDGGLLTSELSIMEAVSENGDSGTIDIDSLGYVEILGNVDLSTLSGTGGSLNVDSGTYLLVGAWESTNKIDASAVSGTAGNVYLESKDHLDVNIDIDASSESGTAGIVDIKPTENNFNLYNSTINARSIIIETNVGDRHIILDANSKLLGENISLDGKYINLNGIILGDNISLSSNDQFNLYNHILLNTGSSISGTNISLLGQHLILHGVVSGGDVSLNGQYVNVYNSITGDKIHLISNHDNLSHNVYLGNVASISGGDILLDGQDVTVNGVISGETVNLSGKYINVFGSISGDIISLNSYDQLKEYNTIYLDGTAAILGGDVSLNGQYLNVYGSITGDKIHLISNHDNLSHNVYLGNVASISGEEINAQGLYIYLHGQVEGDNINIKATNQNYDDGTNQYELFASIYVDGVLSGQNISLISQNNASLSNQSSISGGNVVFNIDSYISDYSEINADNVTYNSNDVTRSNIINAPLIVFNVKNIYGLNIFLQEPTVVIGNRYKNTLLASDPIFTASGNTTFPLFFIDIRPSGLPNTQVITAQTSDQDIYNSEVDENILVIRNLEDLIIID